MHNIHNRCCCCCCRGWIIFHFSPQHTHTQIYHFTYVFFLLLLYVENMMKNLLKMLHFSSTTRTYLSVFPFLFVSNLFFFFVCFLFMFPSQSCMVYVCFGFRSFTNHKLDAVYIRKRIFVPICSLRILSYWI